MAAAAPDDPLIDRFIDALWLEDGLSANTLAAYRRDLTQLARWLHGQGVALDAATDAWLQRYMAERHASSRATSANRRLTVFKRYYRWALRERRIAADPTLRLLAAKMPLRVPRTLSEAQVEALLAAPDTDTPLGLRDRAMLELLYATGLRVSELVALKHFEVSFDMGVVRVFGKGRKERICPLWPETVTLIEKLLERQPRAPDERIFVNRYGKPLGASGVRFKLAAYVDEAAKAVPSLRSKHVTPHSFRHATAVHLVAAGVDITVIRSWLGHVSLDTTNHYAQANLETKRKALEQVGAPAASNVPPSWKRDASLMEWLDTL